MRTEWFWMILGAALTLLVAEQAPAQGTGDPAALAQSLPEKTLRRLREAPRAFLEETSALIQTFGNPAGLDPGGIEAFIAVKRADLRAQEMTRVLEADLDNDGGVTRDELALTLLPLASSARGKLLVAHAEADGNHDGTVDGPELRTMAAGRAERIFSAEDAVLLRRLMDLDLDRNGKLAFPEIEEAARMLESQT